MINALKFCPACGLEAISVEGVDLHAQEFTCVNRHSFFLQEKLVSFTQHTGNFLKLSSAKIKPVEVALDWLQTPSLREHLNDDVASRLKILLMLINGSAHAFNFNETASSFYSFCFVCGAKWEKQLATQDGYQMTYHCENGHAAGGRKGLFYKRGGLEFRVLFNPGPDTLAETVNSFLVKTQWQKAISTQVLEILPILLQQQRSQK